MQRLPASIPSVTVGVTAAASEEILYGGYSGGFLFFPAGATTATITWWVAEKAGGTYMAAYDQDHVAVTQTVAASHACEIPTALFGAEAIKAVGDVATTVAVSRKA